MAFQGAIKSKTQITKGIHRFEHRCGVLLHSDAFWIEECQCNYQHAMSITFRDYLWKTVECYVNDIIVKSHNEDNHLHDLRTIFYIMRAHQSEMNPIKSFLGGVKW